MMSLLLVLEQWAVLLSITWPNGVSRQVVVLACLLFLPCRFWHWSLALLRSCNN